MDTRTMKLNDKDRLRIVVLVVLFSILSIQFVSSAPIPLGIDGNVFMLDGLTEVSAGTNVLIQNLDTGWSFGGSTGRGSPGRYSFVLEGSLGDTIRVTAFTAYSNASRDLALEGILHDVYLLLNFTLENSPPNIISTPLATGIDGTLWTYQLLATDLNNDHLEYALLEGPSGMSINSSGFVSWNAIKGSHAVSLGVSDGKELTSQNFTLVIYERNSPPVRLGGLPTMLKAGNVFKYILDSYDSDNDSVSFVLLDSSIPLTLTNNVLRVPIPSDFSGNTSVILLMTDGFNNETIVWNFVVLNNTGSIDDLEVLNPIVGRVQENSIQTFYVAGTENHALEASASSGEIIVKNNAVFWKAETPGLIRIELKEPNKSFDYVFWVFVNSVNDAPRILSTPPARITAGEIYYYLVNAIDEEGNNLTYFLETGPKNMKMQANGQVVWRTGVRDVGKYDIAIRVSDGLLSTKQKYVLEVATDLGHIIQVSTPDNAQSGFLSSSGVSVQFSPGSTVPLPAAKPVTTYFKLDGTAGYVNFWVSKKWLKRWNIGKESIALKHLENGWVDIPALPYEETEENVYYSSFVPSFSFFAIGIKEDESFSLPEPRVEQVKESYLFMKKLDGVFEQPEWFIVTDSASRIQERILSGGPENNMLVAMLPFKDTNKVTVASADNPETIIMTGGTSKEVAQTKTGLLLLKSLIILFGTSILVVIAVKRMERVRK
ncbi:MAG: PGF-pre-PGF domain-containing protein [Candidatus Woesearchaeota archaeon]